MLCFFIAWVKGKFTFKNGAIKKKKKKSCIIWIAGYSKALDLTCCLCDFKLGFSHFKRQGKERYRVREQSGTASVVLLCSCRAQRSSPNFPKPTVGMVSEIVQVLKSQWQDNRSYNAKKNHQEKDV